MITTLSVDDTVDWNSWKIINEITVMNPKKNLKMDLESLIKPDLPIYESMPFETEERFFEPKLNVWDKIFPGSKSKKIEKSKNAYNEAVSIWEKRKIQSDEKNKSLELKYQEKL